MFGGQARAQGVEHGGLEVVCQADEGAAEGCFEVEGVHQVRGGVWGRGERVGAFRGGEAEHGAHHREGFGAEHGLLRETVDVGDGVFGHGHAVGGFGAGHGEGGEEGGVDGDGFVVAVEEALDGAAVGEGFGVGHGGLGRADVVGGDRRRCRCEREYLREFHCDYVKMRNRRFRIWQLFLMWTKTINRKT